MKYGVGRTLEARRYFGFFPASSFQLLALNGLFLAAYGCAVVGPISGHVPAAAPQPAGVLDDGYTDVTGVIHVHTTYSHDANGRFEDVVRVANAQGLDYVILTDHNTLQPLRDGKQGRHGSVLILIGEELSTRGGHYVAMNVSKEVSRHQPVQRIIDKVNQQGGFGFIAHPYFAKRRWTDWTVHGYTGMEIYNAAHDVMDDNRLRIAAWSIALPADAVFLSILNRPYDPLSKWDELLARGKVVGIGAADAHEIHVMGLKIAPYEMMFKLVRTHVLQPRGTPLSAASLYDALRRGHAYVAIDLVTDARHFAFMADNHTDVLGVMGDDVALTPNLELTTILPATAQVTLFKDGKPIASVTERAWRVPVTEPGVYRVEASLHGKPWIFSNPIYVKRSSPNAWP